MAYRIDDINASAALPALPTDYVGTPGYFQGKIIQTGQLATRIRYWWLNMVQEELIAPVLRAGIALVKGTNNQLLTAMLTLFGGQTTCWRYLYATTTLTVPVWGGGIEYELVGGGGGGGAAGASGSGGGGGAGGEAWGWCPLVPGQQILATIAAGGTNGAVAGNIAAAGGTTSLGAIAAASGGTGGYGGEVGGVSAGGRGTGGAGGAGIDGGIAGAVTFVRRGQDGSDGGYAMAVGAGIGGSSRFGGGGKTTTNTATGAPGNGYGSGGGGSYNDNGPGGTGTAGLIRYRWTA